LDQLAHLRVVEVVIVVTVAAGACPSAPIRTQVEVACQLIEVGAKRLPVALRSGADAVVLEEAVDQRRPIENGARVCGVGATRVQASVELVSGAFEIQNKTV
jgi:hypothetical protein